MQQVEVVKMFLDAHTLCEGLGWELNAGPDSFEIRTKENEVVIEMFDIERLLSFLKGVAVGKGINPLKAQTRRTHGRTDGI